MALKFCIWAVAMLAVMGSDMKVHGHLEVDGNLDCSSAAATTVHTEVTTINTLNVDSIKANEIHTDVIHLN